MRNKVIGNWSLRPFIAANGGVGYDVSRKGSRSHWDIKADIRPTSDGKCFVVSMNGYSLDARASLDEAIELVMSRLDR